MTSGSFPRALGPSDLKQGQAPHTLESDLRCGPPWTPRPRKQGQRQALHAACPRLPCAARPPSPEQPLGRFSLDHLWGKGTELPRGTQKGEAGFGPGSPQVLFWALPCSQACGSALLSRVHLTKPGRRATRTHWPGPHSTDGLSRHEGKAQIPHSLTGGSLPL